MPTVTVLIPTYMRPVDLHRCLVALEKQTVLPDQVIVVKRRDDFDTEALLKKFTAKSLPLDVCEVDLPGVVHAMNQGVQKALSDITVLTDDDSEAPPDWIDKIRKAFACNPKIVGVGGRDTVTFPDGSIMHGKAKVVGKITFYGRVTGNHHAGVGGIRSVDVLKGVNSAYLTASLKVFGFDTNLRGSGAQTHWEVALGRRIANAKGSLLYDPDIFLVHHVSTRHDEDQRLKFNAQAFFNSVHNEIYSICIGAKLWKSATYIAWHTFIGHKSSPGLAYSVAKFIATGDKHEFTKLCIAMRARAEALITIASVAHK